MINRTDKMTGVITLVSLITIISIIVLSFVSTFQLDFLFLLLETQSVDLFSTISNIVVGEIGVAYYFLLPGLPLILYKRRQEFFSFCRTVTVAITYSATGSYVTALVLMLVGYEELSIMIPLALTLLSSLIFIRNVPMKRESNDDSYETNYSNMVSIDMRLILTSLIVLVLLVLFIFLRLVIFSNLVVEWSDGLEYNRMISDMNANNYLFNEYHSRWAPAYPIFGFLISQMSIPNLVSLKAVSFFFSVVSIFPMLAIYDRLNGARKNNHELRYILLIFWCYPWMNILASANLQDMTLTFFVISFTALIFSNHPAYKAAAGFAAGLAFVLRYSLGLLGPLGLVYILASNSKYRNKEMIRYFTGWLVFVIPWITRNLLIAGVFLSRTDEALIDPGNITSNLSLVTQSEIFNIVNLMGLLPIVLCVPLIVAFFLKMWKANNIGLYLKQFLSRELVLLYAMSVLQFLVIFMFETPQIRFMFSVGWMFPILWITFAKYLELVQIKALVFGWVFWCFVQITYFLRTYWYLIFTRFPIQEGLGSYTISFISPPSIGSWVIVSVCAMLFVIIPLTLRALEKKQTIDSVYNSD